MKPDKIHLFLALLIIITIASWITSCSHKADITGLPEVCFERDILPIYINNCAITGCHDGVNTVVPGNPGSSRSYQAIISKWGQNKMPPSQPVSLENRIMIRVWIEQGARQTVCSITKAPDNSLLSEQKNSQFK